MNLNQMKLTAVLAHLLFLLPWTLSNAAERPNFVFVLTDDQSYAMMGCDGNEVTHPSAKAVSHAETLQRLKHGEEQRTLQRTYRLPHIDCRVVPKVS